MSNRNLKPGWKVWRFDQIAINVNDRVEPGDVDVDHYVGLEHLDPDSLKIRRWGSPGDVEATKLLFKTGDIIFGRRRVYQRKLAVAEFDGICSAHAIVLRPNIDVVFPEFLPFFMQSDLFMNRALEISVGSLSPTINWRTLAKQEFTLPPLEEQRRIANLFIVINWTINSYRSLMESNSYLQHSSGIEYFSKFTNANTRKLNSLTVKIGSGKTPRGGLKVYTSQGVLFLRSQNIYPEGLRLDNVAYIPATVDAEMSSTRVKKGDVLLNITGASIGRCTIYNLDYEANVNQHVCIIRTQRDLNPAFLSYYLQSQVGQRQILAHKTIGNREGLNFKQLGSFQIPVPTLRAQQEIIKYFDKLTNANQLFTTRIESMKKIKKNHLTTLIEK